MRYSVGQKVRIKSLDWYNENKDEDGYVDGGRFFFDKDMTKFCGEVLTIIAVNKESYFMDGGYYADWTDEMIEGLVEEKTLIERFDDKGLPFNEWLSHKGAFHVPDGYELKDENGNVINATKIVLEKKKKEYPKTYEECCKIMGVKLSDCYIQGYKSPLLEDLQELLICRDAYWKIAGEEMGLSKPWEPDWTYNGATKYCIGVSENEIQNFSSSVAQYILAFPTEEMRDTFKENFKSEIESCKELL